MVVALFLATLPAYYTLLQTVCTGALCGAVQPTPDSAQAMQKLGLSIGAYATFILALTLALAFLCFAVSAVIFWRKSDDWMALLVALTVATTVTLSGSVYGTGMNSAWGVLAMVFNVLTSGLYVLVLLLFPDGRFVPLWTRWLLLCGVVAALLSFMSNVYNLVFYAVLGMILIAQVYRYRTASSPLQRQQGKWFIFGGIVVVIIIVGLIVPQYIFPSFGQAGSFYLLVNIPIYIVISLYLPLCIGLAMLRYRLWDIDLIIHRTLVYGLLTVSIVGIYALAVGTLGTLLQVQGNFFISLLAAGLVAVLFQPLRLRLQRGVNRLMYGERYTPNKVISRLGQRLETTLAPDAVLPTIVETVAQALKLPYAAISLKQGGEFVPAAFYGQAPKEGLVRLPLVYQNEQVGELLLAPRAPGETFSSADRALLDDLARQAGVAASAVRLTTDLQRLAGELQHSRTQLVTTREEERRRLRRDLHDGLGPALGSLTLQLDTARNLFKSDPPAADALLVDLKTQVQTAIADIRRLVYELRPPTLDELGLVSALHEQVTRYRQPGLSITLNAPEHVPPLPAAVEVAIYRIAQEALTNVARHAHAQHCVLTLEVDNDVCLEVRDDGQGPPADYRAGVGLTSMHERAAELGGTCAIAPVEAGGTRVFIRLPLLKE